MELKVSRELSTILSYAKDEAMRTGHYGIGADHLVLGAIRHGNNEICSAIKALGADTAELKALIDKAIFKEQGIAWGDADGIGLTKKAHGILAMARMETLRFGQDCTGPAHLLLALCRVEDSVSAGYFTTHGIGYDTVRAWLEAGGCLTSGKDNIRLKAEDIADALEAEIRRASAAGILKSDTIYS